MPSFDGVTKERWVSVVCPSCGKEACKVNLESRLPGKIVSVTCSKCSLFTHDWSAWVVR